MGMRYDPETGKHYWPSHSRESEIATLPARHYTTFLEVALPDGRHTYCELRLVPQEPIGFSAPHVGKFWIRLLNSLVERRSLTHWLEELDSLRGGHQGVLDF